jgi:hypothetical protein
MESQCPDGHVAVFLGRHHFVHGRDFVGTELRRRRLGTAGAVVKRAHLLEAAPDVIPGRRQSEHPEDNSKREHLAGALDGLEEARLLVTGRHALPVQAKAREANDEHEQADEGSQDANPPTELEHLELQLLLVVVEDGGRHDGPASTTKPTSRRRAWDSEVREEVGIAARADEITEAVVIRSAGGCARDRAGMPEAKSRRKPDTLARPVGETPKESAVLQLQRLKSRMS